MQHFWSRYRHQGVKKFGRAHECFTLILRTNKYLYQRRAVEGEDFTDVDDLNVSSALNQKPYFWYLIQSPQRLLPL